MMTIRHVNVQQAHQAQASGATYLDVRSIPEFEAGHPEGAYNIPLAHLDPVTHQMRPNAEFLDVVRAVFPPAQACELLSNIGYQDVSNVLGGFSGSPQTGHPGWTQLGLPIEQSPAPEREYEALRKKAAGAR